MRELLLTLFSCAVVLAGPVPIHAQQPVRSSGEAVGGSIASEARVLPGDQVALRIFREPEMSGAYPVAGNGEIVLPRLGRVVVTDLSAVELQDSLRTAYSHYLRNPAIEVTILRRIGVHGEVRRPDVYMVDLTTTLRDVLAKAGGVTEAGNLDRISIVRDGQEIRMGNRDSARVLAAELHSGDQIVVGRRSWLSLNALGLVSTAAVAVSVFVPLIRSLTS